MEIYLLILKTILKSVYYMSWVALYMKVVGMIINGLRGGIFGDASDQVC